MIYHWSDSEIAVLKSATIFAIYSRSIFLSKKLDCMLRRYLPAHSEYETCQK